MTPRSLTPLLCALGLAALPGASLFAQPVESLEGERFEATLAGQAILPAETAIAPPEDAPALLRHSGRFTGPDNRRETTLNAHSMRDGVRPTGGSLPMEGQPVQGFSGISALDDGTFWTLSDNGFGRKLNSPDAALMLHRIEPDWQTGELHRLETIFLSDPERVAPFPITLEGSNTRYLTGADFDIESIQPVEDGFWIGEEFGPWLLKFDRQGRLQALFDTRTASGEVSSPDDYGLSLPSAPDGEMPAFNLRRSGGFEGMAITPDGEYLLAMLEGPLHRDGAPEQVADGRTALRVLEFDISEEAWTGRSWHYPLGEGGAAIGDFNMLDDTTGLVIERDHGAGRPALACEGEPRTDCFAEPAQWKRIYSISFDGVADGEPVEKLGYIDLMDIRDPEGIARQGGQGDRYDMPFVTIENVDRVDERHIIVGNDNNYPFSAGRALDRADDNEFVLLEVSELLKAR